MEFIGISRKFLLTNEEQYDTIGRFWDELASKYGLENLQGLGYKWQDNYIFYAIGLKNKVIDNHNFKIILPDNNWKEVLGKTDNLKEIYDKIYLDGPLKYEIETFYENGECKIKYIRV